MPLRTRMDSGVPNQFFFTTPAQRIALARQRFFEEGTRPSGLVPEPVIQSWIRCTSAQARTSSHVAFDPVTSSRMHGALGRNRELLNAARPDLMSLESSLAGSDCRVLLTDGDGIIVHATHNPQAAQAPILHAAARVGVNLAEGAVGTTAPGIVAKTGVAATVLGAEHFYDCLQGFQCAAAPIRNVKGQLAAVLNLSVESRSFGFDAASVIGLYATSIENSLLQAQSREHLVVQFQASPGLLGTSMEALVGITSDGAVAWLNVMASRLTGTLPGALPLPAEDVLGLALPTLLRLIRSHAVQPMRLPSGLGVWVKARVQAEDGADFNHAVAVSASPMSLQAPPITATHLPNMADDATLGEHSRKFIEDTLTACDANISRAARTLGVSRGTLYRRLKSWGAKAPAG
jgi:transcriptional regulator of acetoin/glycerol metabolism